MGWSSDFPSTDSGLHVGEEHPWSRSTTVSHFQRYHKVHLSSHSALDLSYTQSVSHLHGPSMGASGTSI
ncbi:hypothetical protein BD414DRAFT_502023, partial [Trametes punicea]